MVQKIDYIQFWRAVAILFVIITHAAHIDSAEIGIKAIDNFIYLGQQGVTLFFVISAFTIFYSIDSKLSVEKNNYSHFLLRRFFRIAPLYYLGISFYSWHLIHNFTFNADIILNIFFIHWLKPSALNAIVPGGWSITTEFTFYFFAPFLFNYIKNIKSATTLFLYSILASRLLVSILVLIYPDAGNLYYILNPLSQFPVFIIGLILYFMIIKKEQLALSSTHLILISIIVFLNYTILFVAREHTIFAIFWALLILLSSKFYRSSVFNIPFSFIGNLSFTIYITHFAVLRYLTDHNLFHNNSILDAFLRIIVTTVLSIIISYPIHILFEKPLMNFGKRLTKKLVQKREPTPVLHS